MLADWLLPRNGKRKLDFDIAEILGNLLRLDCVPARIAGCRNEASLVEQDGLQKIVVAETVTELVPVVAELHDFDYGVVKLTGQRQCHLEDDALVLGRGVVVQVPQPLEGHSEMCHVVDTDLLRRKFVHRVTIRIRFDPELCFAISG